MTDIDELRATKDEIQRLEKKVARYAILGTVCGAVGVFLILLALAL